MTDLAPVAVGDSTVSASGPRRRAVMRPATIVAVVLVGITAVASLLPFGYLGVYSVIDQDGHLGGGTMSRLFQALPVWHQLANSALLAVGVSVVVTVLSALAGFAFAKLGFPFYRALLTAISAMILIPFPTILLPEYVNLSDLGLLDGFVGAALVYTATGLPFSTLLMTNYFRGVPDELVESGVVDGASHLRVFRSLLLPISGPALTTVAVLQFIAVWNDLLIALLFMPNTDNRTIAVGLATLAGTHQSNLDLLIAGSFISAVPAVCVYLFFNRYIVAGITGGIGK